MKRFTEKYSRKELPLKSPLSAGGTDLKKKRCLEDVNNFALPEDTYLEESFFSGC